MDGVVIDFFNEELIEVLVKVLYVVLYDEVLKNEVWVVFLYDLVCEQWVLYVE